MTQKSRTGVHLLHAVNAFGHIMLEPFFLLNPGPDDPEKMIILYPDDRQPANPAVIKIIRRYFEVIAISAEQFKLVMQGKLSLKDKHGNSLVRMPPVNFAIDRWAEKLIRGDLNNPRFLELSEEEMEEGKKIQNSIGLGLDEPFVCIHNREAGYHKHIVNQKYRDSQITSFLPAIEYLIKNKFRVVRIGDASMAPLPSIPGLIDLTQMRNKHPLTDIWMGTHCVFMMCHPSGPLSIPIAFNGPPVLIVNLVDHPTYPMHPQDRYILKPIRIRHQGGRLLDFNERMLVMRHHPRDKDFEYYGLDIHPNSADEILDATEEMVEDISKGNGVDRTTPLQRAFRQTARQWNRLYSTFRSFEPYYLFNMPLSNRYLERYAGLLVKESLTTGKTLFQEGKLDEAHTYFGDILQVNPENHEALNNMGTVFYAKGDLSAAETRFLKAFSFSPDDDDILLNLIDLYIGQKRWREAIPLLERYLTHQCSDYERLNQLAVAYMEYDASHKAVPILLRSLAIEPEQAIVHEALYTLQLMSPASPTRG